MIYMVFILIKPFSDHWCNVDAVIIIIEETTFIRREIFIVKGEGDQSEELCMREESLQINTTKYNQHNRAMGFPINLSQSILIQ